MAIVEFLSDILSTIDKYLQDCENVGALPSAKIPVWNFENSTCPMERHIPVARTRPFGYRSCKQDTKERYCRDNNFVKWKGTVWSDRPTEMTGRPVEVDHLQRWFQIFRSDRTEMVRSIWFLTENSGIFELNEKPPVIRLQRRISNGILKLINNLLRKYKGN